MGDDTIKSGIIEQLYANHSTLMIGISARFFDNVEDRLDAVQGFFADKICNKPIDKIRNIQAAGAPLLYKAFQRYCIDIYRKQKKRREATERYIAEISQQTNKTIGITIENQDDVLQNIREKITAKFGRDYAIIFELIINDYKNPQIANIMQKPVATIGTIKHRIKRSFTEAIHA